MKSDDNRLVRFDWAIKRLLRQKVNHAVLEGFLSSLLGRKISIIKILESESNREYDENKQNRVDMLAEEADGTKILIEVQNESEDAYFHRMLFGTSRVISEYLNSGDNYDKITKIYNINIVYFNLGEGDDYVYHGTSVFRGIHNNELLRLSGRLKEKYKVEEIRDIFPEYYILRANDFDKWSRTPLDQWMYFLSKSEIPDDADAPGLKEASDQLRISKLSIEERGAYLHHMREMNSLRDMFTSNREQALYEGRQQGLAEGRAEGLEQGLAEGRAEGRAEGLEQGLAEGRAEGRAEGIKEGEQKGTFKIARNLINLGMSVNDISKVTGLSEDEINSLD